MNSDERACCDCGRPIPIYDIRCDFCFPLFLKAHPDIEVYGANLQTAPTFPEYGPVISPQSEASRRFYRTFEALVDAIGPDGIDWAIARLRVRLALTDRAIARLRVRLALTDRAIEAIKSYETVNSVSPDSKCSE
jgi:hypothetical protein